MTLSASYIYYEVIFERANEVHRVFIHYASMAKLPIDTSAPSEDLAFIVNGSSMVVSKRELGDCVSSELLQDPWSRLFFGV